MTSLFSLCYSHPGSHRKGEKMENNITIPVVIEVPKGSRNKYEFDHKRDIIKFDRMLFSSVHYPSDYGFIPDTLGEDGDPLDALVLVTEPTFPGCLIEARPVGLFKMVDEMGIDDKILCVPVKDPLWNHIFSLAEIPHNLLREIEHFFTIYKDLEEKKTDIKGWKDLDAALKVIEEAKQRFQNNGL